MSGTITSTDQPNRSPSMDHQVGAAEHARAQAWHNAVAEAHRGTHIPPHAPHPDDKGVLGRAWDWTTHETAAAGKAIGSFDSSHGHVLTRGAGVLQAAGGVAETLSGAAIAGLGGAATATGVGAAPGIPAMIGGGALAVNGADNAVAGLRTALSGSFHHTLISEAAGAGARAAGASPATASRITNGVDLAQGLAGGGASIAAGIARKGAANAVKLSTKAAEGMALQAQTAGAKQGAASCLRVGNQTFKDVSSAARARMGGARTAIHPVVQEALDKVPPAVRSPFHGNCAEVGCLSQALEKGVSPAGGFSAAVKIKAAGHMAHATPMPPCSSCADVLHQLKVKY